MGEHCLGVDDLRGLISRVDAKIDRLDEKLDRRIDSLDHRFSRQLKLLLVFHLTTLGAILVGFLTRRGTSSFRTRASRVRMRG